MKIIIISIAAIALTQVIKIIWFYFSANARSRHSFLWPAFWMGGFPSSHAAALVSALYVIWKYDGINLLFGFGFIVSLLVFYGLLEDKKRQVLFEEYFVHSKDSSLQKIVAEGHLLSFSGHSLRDIVVGGCIGISVGFIGTTFFL